jgi:hypothetical protein
MEEIDGPGALVGFAITGIGGGEINSGGSGFEDGSARAISV